MMSYIYLFLTIVFTVYGQIIIKWQVNKAGALPQNNLEKISFLIHLLLNPWVFSAFLVAFFASLTWMAAVTKLQLSFAYPFISLSFVLVLISSSLFFNETMTLQKIFGMCFIVAGIIIGSQAKT